MTIPKLFLGQTDLSITRLGLGAMPLSIYGRPSVDKAIEVIHRTFDLGINLIDIADAYCLDENDKHYSETLVFQALKTYSKSIDDDLVVATKGGLIRPGGAWETDLTPSRLRQAIRKSYECLGGEKAIPLWQLHNSPQDERYSMKEIFEPICEAVDSKLIRYVGVSNFNLEQLKEAQTYVDIQSVQNVYSVFKRAAESNGVLQYCEENRLTFLAYSPFGGRRKHRQINKQRVLIDLAKKYQCSCYCIALAWLLSKSSCLVPIPGASQISSIEDSIKAIDLQLDPRDIQLIDQTKFV